MAGGAPKRGSRAARIPWSRDLRTLLHLINETFPNNTPQKTARIFRHFYRAETAGYNDRALAYRLRDEYTGRDNQGRANAAWAVVTADDQTAAERTRRDVLVRQIRNVRRSLVQQDGGEVDQEGEDGEAADGGGDVNTGGANAPPTAGGLGTPMGPPPPTFAPYQLTRPSPTYAPGPTSTYAPGPTPTYTPVPGFPPPPGPGIPNPLAATFTPGAFRRNPFARPFEPAPVALNPLAPAFTRGSFAPPANGPPATPYNPLPPMPTRPRPPPVLPTLTIPDPIPGNPVTVPGGTSPELQTPPSWEGLPPTGLYRYPPTNDSERIMHHAHKHMWYLVKGRALVYKP